jgi:protein-S-isoprenylcysteine O-methyltransferase Ste14
MRRWTVFAFGVLSYGVFFASFGYGILFVENLWVPRTVDAGGPVDTAWNAALINTALIALFGLHHSVAARSRFKELVPASIERNVYVLLASLLLGLVFWQWRPIPRLLWSVEGVPAILLRGASWLGWGLALWSSFSINHWDLFGLRQAILTLRGKAYEPIPFQTPPLYRLVRHPLMLGLLLAFWAAPTMSVGRLLFAATMSAYILLGVALEERDSLRYLGQPYREYQKRVPALLPFPRRSPSP